MIRFLIDENLPATLATKLPVVCMHATDLGEQPTDTFLWEYARGEGWSLLTKDTDFFDRLTLIGPPPKVVWLRTGNLRRMELEELVAAQIHRVLSLLEGADLVEVHADRLETFKF